MEQDAVERKRQFVIYVESVYLILLFAFAWFYLKGWFGILALPNSSIGRLPIGVPWFGALGAVLISLTGTFDHRRDWDPTWDSWHYTRPLIGAALAVVSWVIFQAGILAVGAVPPKQPATVPKNLLFYLIAFVVGYREAIFRELIKRVADVVLTPATPPAAQPPTIARLNPPSGKAAGGETVIITGSGFDATSTVKFGNAAATVRVNSPTEISVTTPQGTAGQAQVTVSTKAGSATTGNFNYT